MNTDFDVVVVGCGPVGAFAANLLARNGLSTLVVDRDDAPYSLPRAVHFDHEMLRLLEDAGLLAPIFDRIRATDGHLHVGADHGVIRYLSAAGKPRPFGYANDYFFYQPELEEVLRAGLGRFAHAELRLGAELVGLTQTDSGVQLRFADGDSLSARWVLGADGARSTIRKALGVRLDDLDFEEPWLVVDAEVEGPITFPPLAGTPQDADLQRLSVMMCDPARPATIVPGRGSHRRWEFMLLPGEDDATMAAKAGDLVRPWVADAPHRILRAATYRFHGLVAERWRVGRVFLAGDAAHQTPPFFGQGMCHGLRDVANLAWKLAMVVKGEAGESLLDTYQTERDAQVRHVIGKAIEAGRYICVLDPVEAAARDVRVRAMAGIKTAAELIAPLVSPIIGQKAGERFINPPVEIDGRLLDAATGGGWRFFATGKSSLKDSADRVLDRLGARRLVIGRDIADAEGWLKDWFEARGATMALVRPDFYLAALGGEAEDFSAEIDRLGAAMDLAVASAAVTEHAF
jgi:3-(3-hydroxy-phenyl)propionate hydroxylase